MCFLFVVSHVRTRTPVRKQVDSASETQRNRYGLRAGQSPSESLNIHQKFKPGFPGFLFFPPGGWNHEVVREKNTFIHNRNMIQLLHTITRGGKGYEIHYTRNLYAYVCL